MSAETFQRRRERLMTRLPAGITLVRGAGPGGVNANFRYLTGLEDPAAALLLSSGGVRIETGRTHPGRDYLRGRIVRQILFLPPRDGLAVRWGEDSAVPLGSVEPAALGVDATLAASELDRVLASALGSAEAFHYVRSAPPTLSSSADPDADFVASVRHGFFALEIGDATPEVHEMRRLKDDGEVDAIRRAVDLTAEAVRRAMRAARAGAREYELEAEITRTYRARGGRHAFEPIVAAGPNALRLHYRTNDGRLAAGQLVLLDTGASLEGYRADVSRTFPVDGVFTDRQREVYEVVLAALDAAIGTCRRGALLADVHATAFAAIEDAGLGEHFVHGTSHYLGLETHDVGDVHRPLEPGAVITVEPGVYLDDEGLGVRIEDDVLVTADGPVNLTAAIPRTVADVERALAEGG